MKSHLNTLFLTTQGSFAGCDGETVKIRIEEKTKLQVPIHLLEGIVCFGHILVSPALMALCAQRGVAVAFLTENGRFLARVQGRVSGNVLLRRAQYRKADDPSFSAGVARLLVGAKIQNCRTGLQRALRDREQPVGGSAIKSAVDRLAALQLHLRNQELGVEEIRGYEGEAARTYFGAFDHLILAQKDSFYFHGRSRRPPMDRMNCLLSFLYTLLAFDMGAALESVGLDPAVGYLHEERPGRPGLALDLMEEFRPVLADRLALSLVNKLQLKPNAFRTVESGAVEMTETGRKELLVAYQERKRETLKHPFLEEEMPLGLVLQMQARLFARFLRGDLANYPPFIWR